MTRRILHVCLFLAFLLAAIPAHAQVPSAFPYAKPVQNDSSVGTTQFTLTKINSSGNAVIMATTDTNGYAGVCVSNCGKTGTAWIAFAGLVPLTVDATATVQHYITISSTTGGDGHDSGATTYPTSGAVIGRVQAGATSGNQAMVDLFSAEVQAASGGGGSGGNPAIVANDTVTGTTVNQIAVWNAGSTGAVVATSAAQGGTGNSFIGICSSGCGTTGNASIVTAGYVQCTSDNAATMGHYAVQGSTGVFGECHDSGVAYGSTPPAYSIGVFTTTGAAGLQGLNLRADANQFLGTLRLYGVVADGPGVYNAALSYDNNNSNYTAGWNVGGNTAYGAFTGGTNNVNSMARGILTIPNGTKTISFTWPSGSSGQTYSHAPICPVSLVETTQGTVPADGGHSVFTSATTIQVDSTNAAPAAGWIYYFMCFGNPN